MKRRGQIGTLRGVIVAVLIIAILLGAGFLLLEEFQSNDSFYNSGTELNETGAFFNSTGYTVDNADLPGFQNFAVTQARNGSSGLVIGTGNYTCNVATGTCFNATAKVWANVQLDYTYEAGTQGYDGIATTITALLTVPNLLGLIILIVVIGIVLSIVFRVVPGQENGA